MPLFFHQGKKRGATRQVSQQRGATGQQQALSP
nr:MAG TPA: hypothetical protein [Caudoviricetes sp.]